MENKNVMKAVELINEFIEKEGFEFVDAYPYEDAVMVIGDGGIPEEIIFYFENLANCGTIKLSKDDLIEGYSDEYGTCSRCGKVVSLLDASERIELDGERICSDCLDKDEEAKRDYIEEIANNYKIANTIVDEEFIKSLGFNLEGEYSISLHGDEDEVDPSELTDKFKGKYDVVFHIDSSDIFTTTYKAYIREVDYE